MTLRLFRLLGVGLVLAALDHPLGAMAQRARAEIRQLLETWQVGGALHP